MFSVSEASVAVITGGSSGIGLNAARALRDRSLNVYELSRRAENAEPGVTHLQADVTDETQVNAAVAEILRREGRIDILINNAGFGISGAIEFTPPQEARRQFDVNFFGMVNMNRAVLPVMRQQGGGRIVNMSSVAAPIAIPFQAYYSASKARPPCARIRSRSQARCVPSASRSASSCRATSPPASPPRGAKAAAVTTCTTAASPAPSL